jgi:deazaflavin-dependent oxidoreductase (nitroreductase family)
VPVATRGGDRTDAPRAEADPAQRLEGGLEQRVAALGRGPGGRVQQVDGALIVGQRRVGGLRRSGRQYVLPVQYASAGDLLVVRPQHWQHSTWWRNFRTTQPVTVRLAGRLHEGTARVVDPGDPQWRSARQTYATRWPRFARRVTGPLVVISLRP